MRIPPDRRGAGGDAPMLRSGGVDDMGEEETGYLREALKRAAAGETAGDTDSSVLCSVAAGHLLGVLDNRPSPKGGGDAHAAERERRYLFWAAVREAGKIERARHAVPRDAFPSALSSRRFLSAFLWAVPLGELEEALSSVPLPGFARAILKNRRMRRGAAGPSFTGAPVTAQVYLRDPDTIAALREFSALSGLPESAVAKEAVKLGARAFAGALAPRAGAVEALDAVEADTRMKELSLRVVAEATEKLKKEGIKE